MNQIIFKNYANYYDLLYQDKNYLKEVKYINNLLRFFFFKKKLDILEFGSGTGKHGNLLSSLGHRIHGIEFSKEMILKSKLSKRFTCQQGDIAKIRLPKSYDVILSLFHVMNYQITNNRINLVFSNIYKHLRPNGIFIFDFWYTPAVLSQKPSIKIKQVLNKKIEIIRIAEPFIYNKKSRVNVKYDIFIKNLKTGLIKKINEIHKLRHFNLLEIKKLCDAHNFKLVKSEEFISGSKLSKNTWGACVVLKKIAYSNND